MIQIFKKYELPKEAEEKPQSLINIQATTHYPENANC